MTYKYIPCVVLDRKRISGKPQNSKKEIKNTEYEIPMNPLPIATINNSFQYDGYEVINCDTRKPIEEKQPRHLHRRRSSGNYHLR